MNIVDVKISDLKYAEYNPRRLSKKEKSDIRRSLEKFGFVDPIIVNNSDDRKNIIIGGHQRVKVWKSLGNKTVPVFYVCLDEHAEKELNIRLNKNTGDWDIDLLEDFFDRGDLLNWGFDDEDLDWDDSSDVTSVDGDAAEPKIDKADELLGKWGVKTGQVWLLGTHRLMCGDSTSDADVGRLMCGEKADMVFTDPPYGLDGYAGRSGNFDALAGDDENSAELYRAVPLDADNVFVWCEWRTYPRLLEALGEPRSLIVWNKNVFGLGNGYRRKHEFCAYYGSYSGTTESDVWEFSRDSKYMHPTQKPTSLAEKAISIHNPDSILDLFGGSGSTLIAAERTGRKCFMMELEPKYCSVIIERFVDETGEVPTLEK